MLLLSEQDEITMGILKEDLVRVHFPATDKKNCLAGIADSFRKMGVIKDTGSFLKKLLQREEKLSTGIGYGIAVPHLRDSVVKKLVAGIYLLDKEIDFDSLDQKRVKLIICFAIPEQSRNNLTDKNYEQDNRNRGSNEYMRVLQKITRYLHSESNRNTVLGCDNEKELYNIFRRILDE